MQAGTPLQHGSRILSSVLQTKTSSEGKKQSCHSSFSVLTQHKHLGIFPFSGGKHSVSCFFKKGLCFLFLQQNVISYWAFSIPRYNNAKTCIYHYLGLSNH